MNAIETGSYGGVPYVRIGDRAETVVVINGGNAFVRRFEPASAARNAHQIARLFSVDCTLFILGYDTTATPPYDVDAIADAFAEIIRVQLRVQQGAVSLAGISFGGFVATRLAARHPELVRNLILISTAHRFSEEGQRRVREQMASAARGDFLAMARPFLTLFRRRWRNHLLRAVMRLRRKSFAEKMNAPWFIAAMLEAALAASASDPAHLQDVRARTLLVAGTHDQFFDVAAIRETASRIASAQLVLFPQETHMLAVEQPRAAAAAIASFLRG
jgi:pimeloyl-ACP methyl ester carboxylesterase